MWLKRRGEQVELNFDGQHCSGGGGGTANWDGCRQNGCLGRALPQTGACFEHSSLVDRQRYLADVRQSAGQLELSGTRISQQLWDEIVASPVFEGGRPVVAVSLTGSEISARIHFNGREFEHSLEMSGASVFAPMEFRSCSFKGGLLARHASFDKGPPAFYQCDFEKDVDVSYSHVDGVSFGFEGCNFARSLIADGFTGGGLILSSCAVSGNASCKSSNAFLILTNANIDGTLDLAGSEFVGFAGNGLVLRSANRLGPFSVSSLQLERATFGSRISIEVRADVVNLSSAAFEEGGLMVVERANVHLEQLRLGGPLRISGKMGSSRKPQALGLRNSDAGKMSFSHVDLSRCSFQGAHGLGTLEVEPSATFTSLPWWAGGRRFIADEYAWRTSAGGVHSFGWRLPGVHVGWSSPESKSGSDELVVLHPLEADQVASIYRDLRRSLEAKSDMPGASDFYYGEMEMRRWSRGRPWIERVLVWCYWLASGYGLRPRRALAAWGVLVAVGAWLLSCFGFPPTERVPQPILTAIQAAIPGLSLHPLLTAQGQWIETGLRVFGAMFITLFFLAARSMVMRKPSE